MQEGISRTRAKSTHQSHTRRQGNASGKAGLDYEQCANERREDAEYLLDAYSLANYQPTENHREKRCRLVERHRIANRNMR